MHKLPFGNTYSSCTAGDNERTKCTINIEQSTLSVVDLFGPFIFIALLIYFVCLLKDFLFSHGALSAPPLARRSIHCGYTENAALQF